MQRVQWVDPSDDPNSAAANSVGKELELRSAVSGLRLFVFVDFVRRGLEPDDTYVRTLGGRRGEKGGGLRAILVALSMPSAGLGEPELDVGLGVGVALDA
jgi:hypothetical protein